MIKLSPDSEGKVTRSLAHASGFRQISQSLKPVTACFHRSKPEGVKQIVTGARVAQE
jgi:hypothetical protein